MKSSASGSLHPRTGRSTDGIGLDDAVRVRNTWRVDERPGEQTVVSTPPGESTEPFGTSTSTDPGPGPGEMTLEQVLQPDPVSLEAGTSGVLDWFRSRRDQHPKHDVLALLGKAIRPCKCKKGKILLLQLGRRQG